MKNLKFFIAVAGIFLASFSSFNSSAKKMADGTVRCVGSGTCGVSNGGCVIDGTPTQI